MQIRSVQPSEVVKVEYYDIPPARWATRADQIVNLITRNPETGYVFGADTIYSLYRLCKWLSIWELYKR
jgi:hypothetical protein